MKVDTQLRDRAFEENVSASVRRPLFELPCVFIACRSFHQNAGNTDRNGKGGSKANGKGDSKAKPYGGSWGSRDGKSWSANSSWSSDSRWSADKRQNVWNESGGGSKKPRTH